jgi:hypothetical protein
MIKVNPQAGFERPQANLVIEPDGYVDGVERVHRELIRAGLYVEAHAIEHQLEVGAFLPAQRPAKDPFPGFELLFNQVTKSGYRSAHKAPPWVW